MRFKPHFQDIGNLRPCRLAAKTAGVSTCLSPLECRKATGLVATVHVCVCSGGGSIIHKGEEVLNAALL